MATTAAIRDVDEVSFEALVVERSREVPVVVDFWASWCAPCRSLTPALERAVSERAGRVELAKVDVDANPRLQATYRVQGIPAVKAFRDGAVADEFAGALAPAQIERFLDALLPSEAEELAAAAAASGDEQALRRALELDPREKTAAAALARLLLRRGEPDEALAVVEPLAATDFELAGLAARARLARSDDPPEEAVAAWDDGDRERALALIQERVTGATGDERELLRALMVGWFTELGPQSELAATHRRRLASALS